MTDQNSDLKLVLYWLATFLMFGVVGPALLYWVCVWVDVADDLRWYSQILHRFVDRFGG